MQITKQIIYDKLIVIENLLQKCLEINQDGKSNDKRNL